MTLFRPLAVVTAVVVSGLVTAGCSGSSRSGGGGSTAASTTSGAGTTTGVGSGSGTTNTPANTPAIPAAPASVGQPLTVFNGELQKVWDKMLPQILGQLSNMASSQLTNSIYTSSAVVVEFRNLRVSNATDMNVAPGLVQMDTNKVELRAPITGDWTLAVTADLRVQLNVGSLALPIDLPVTLYLENLSLQVAADLDDSDPTRPVLQRVGQPQVNFTLRLDSTNSLVQNLTGVLTPPANWLAQQAITLGLAYVMPQLNGLQGVPGPIPGDGAAPLVDSGTNTPFEEVAENVSFKARQINMPHGPVLTAMMDTPATDTWLDAYKNGGTGQQGQVVDYESGGDSAIWTGQTLAGEAFRYGVTGSTLALDNIGHLLGGIGKLLDVNGGSGLLARNAAPETSLAGQRILASGVFRQAMLAGQNWVGRQGSNGISRDQYSGVMFGLAITWELVPSMRPECEYRIRMILDYLIAHDWIVDEDRPAWNPATPATSSRGPTFWAGVNYQKLAFLLIGHRFDPARYASQLAQAGPLSKTAWMGMWTSTFGVDHYYKYNLSHVGLYNYFRLETDQGRWQDLRRAYAMVERYVGHHRNPHFDLIRTSFDPSQQATLFPSIRQALRQFVTGQNHREVAASVIDLSGVTFVNLQTFGYQNTAGGGFTLGGTTQSFPTEPLDLHLRKPSGHFQWQRDPFSPATPSQGNPRAEKVGLDLTLPYWMGRYYGAF